MWALIGALVDCWLRIDGLRAPETLAAVYNLLSSFLYELSHTLVFAADHFQILAIRNNINHLSPSRTYPTARSTSFSPPRPQKYTPQHSSPT